MSARRVVLSNLFVLAFFAGFIYLIYTWLMYGFEESVPMAHRKAVVAQIVLSAGLLGGLLITAALMLMYHLQNRLREGGKNSQGL